MKNHIFRQSAITTVKTQHFTALLRVIEDKGFLEITSRTWLQLYSIMRYAAQQGLTENNPALYLEGVTAPPAKNHYLALPLEPLPELLERIGDYHQGRQLTRLAVVLTLHLFIHSSELAPFSCGTGCFLTRVLSFHLHLVPWGEDDCHFFGCLRDNFHLAKICDRKRGTALFQTVCTDTDTNCASCNSRRYAAS